MRFAFCFLRVHLVSPRPFQRKPRCISNKGVGRLCPHLDATPKNPSSLSTRRISVSCVCVPLLLHEKKTRCVRGGKISWGRAERKRLPVRQPPLNACFAPSNPSTGFLVPRPPFPRETFFRSPKTENRDQRSCGRRRVSSQPSSRLVRYGLVDR